MAYQSRTLSLQICHPRRRISILVPRPMLARHARDVFLKITYSPPFSYPEPFLRAVNGARQGALAKSISNWHLIGYNEGYCSNNVYILLPCFYGIRFWIWPEPLVAPRVRRALGTRMTLPILLLNYAYSVPVFRPWEKLRLHILSLLGVIVFT